MSYACSSTHLLLDLLPFEQRLITELSTHIPLILLPSHQSTLTPYAPLRSYTYHQSPYSRRPSLQGLHNTTTSDALRTVKLASIKPQSVHALRLSLLRSPESLAALRLEAAERFMRWREVERAVGHVLGTSSPPSDREILAGLERTPVASNEDPIAHVRKQGRVHGQERWNKARWEAEWEGALATDVAKTLRARRGKGMERRPTITAPKVHRPRLSPMCTDVGVETSPELVHESQTPHPAYFDPLHLPSLLAFSLSLLGPLKSRLARMFTPGRTSNTTVTEPKASINGTLESGSRYEVGNGMVWAFVGAFCAGVGVGMLLSRSL